MALPEFKQLVDEIKKEIHEINVADLKLFKERNLDFALIDVREPEDWQKGTIPGAATIPRGVLELKIDQVTDDKDKKIVLYCGGGSHSPEDGISQRVVTRRWVSGLERKRRALACASKHLKNSKRCAA
jgi:3-mercaptopyruvate sulfurtransferase SseA